MKPINLNQDQIRDQMFKKIGQLTVNNELFVARITELEAQNDKLVKENTALLLGQLNDPKTPEPTSEPQQPESDLLEDTLKKAAGIS